MDPYHDRKVYHFAGKINAEGHVSALCFKKPRAIDLGRASWTIRTDAVTCPKCNNALSQMIAKAEAKTIERVT